MRLLLLLDTIDKNVKNLPLKSNFSFLATY
jgi:hypothetical protein